MEFSQKGMDQLRKLSDELVAKLVNELMNEFVKRAKEEEEKLLKAYNAAKVG